MSQKNVIICDYCGKECNPLNSISILPTMFEKVCVQNESKQWMFSRIDLCSLGCAADFFADKFYKGPNGGSNVPTSK